MLKRVDKVFTEPFSKALVVKLRRRNYDQQILDVRMRNRSQGPVPEFTDRRRVGIDYSVELPCRIFFNQKFDLVAAIEHTPGGDLEGENTQKHSGHYICHVLSDNNFVTIDDSKSLKYSPIEKIELCTMFIFKRNYENDTRV